MKALEFRKSIPRYLLLKYVAPWLRGLYTSGLAPVALREMPPPPLPGASWLRIAPRLAGICGSDLATICAKGSPYLSPVTSMPFVMGHEVVGDVTEVGSGVTKFAAGDRVVLRPALGCKVRGIDPACESCASGHDALCRNVTRGCISAGIQTGYCRDTGGGFGESLVAHQSQAYAVPDNIEDRAAVLIEPFACAAHAALRVELSEKDTALVIGCGAIGLLTIAALRASGSRARIVAVAKYQHQRELAMSLGADQLLGSGGSTKERYQTWAESLDAEILKPELGKPVVIGGASVTFDCVASSMSLDDSMRFTRSGGTVVVVGMPGIPQNVDWTPMWYKELTVRAAYAYGPERTGGGEKDTFELAIDWMGNCGGRLEAMTGTPYDLADYRAALRSALNTGASGVAKTIFAVHKG